MRTWLFSLALAFMLFGGFALAQTRVPTPQLPPVRVTPVPSPVQAAPLCGNLDDCDGDGAKGIPRGGDDCDDNDRDRFPGNTEVADSRGHDEDCDHTTFGQMDADGDHFVANYAYNTGPDGREYRGDDCDDRHAYINPHAQELPNRLDDDCNGYVDDLAGIWWTPPPE